MTESTIDILIKLPEVCRQTGMGKSTVYDRINEKVFPSPIKLGRYSRWSQAEVQGWVEAQKAARKAA